MENWSDEGLERVISVLLRTGVFLSAAIVLAGGVLYLTQHGSEPAAFRTFHAVAPSYRSVAAVVPLAARLDSEAVIQFGLLLLIATPIARVAFSVAAFIFERDGTYVVISAIVLAILLFSLAYAH